MEMSPYVQDEQDHRFTSLVSLLQVMEYSLEDLRNRKPLPLDVDALRMLIPDGAGINVVARPRKGSE